MKRFLSFLIALSIATGATIAAEPSVTKLIESADYHRKDLMLSEKQVLALREAIIAMTASKTPEQHLRTIEQLLITKTKELAAAKNAYDATLNQLKELDMAAPKNAAQPAK